MKSDHLEIAAGVLSICGMPCPKEAFGKTAEEADCREQEASSKAAATVQPGRRTGGQPEKQETGQGWAEMPEPGGQLATEGKGEREGCPTEGKRGLDEDGTFCSSPKSETSQGLQSLASQGL